MLCYGLVIAHLLCPAAPRGIGGGHVYALDLTPLYRTFPQEVQAGLDPRLAGSDRGLGAAFTRRDNVYEHEDTEGIPIPVDDSPGPAPAWEAAVFGLSSQASWPPRQCPSQPTPYSPHGYSKLGFTPKPPEEREDGWCHAPTLRWHRLSALGLHVQQRAEGLSLVLPPPHWKSVSYVTNVGQLFSEGKLEDLIEPGTNSPFVGYSTEEQAAYENSRRLLYPVLVGSPQAQVNAAGAEPTDGLKNSKGVAVGHTGALGHLGVPAMLIVTGDSALISIKGSTLLEVMFTVPASSTAEGADADGLLTAWGTFSDAGVQGGESPSFRSSFASTSTAIPPAYVEPSAFVPEHSASRTSLEMQPLIQEYVSNSIPRGNASVLSSSWLPQSHKDVLAEAVASLQAVSQAGIWGANAGGWDLALYSPAGFARWPGIARRVAAEVREEKKSEKWLVVATGCTLRRASAFGSFVCL